VIEYIEDGTKVVLDAKQFADICFMASKQFVAELAVIHAWVILHPDEYTSEQLAEAWDAFGYCTRTFLEELRMAEHLGLGPRS
jgi:hypothetical protein